MLNLEELVFKVNTKELTEAVTSLEKLEGAVQSLGEKSATINVKVKQTSSALKEQDKAAKDTAESTAKLAKNAGEAAPKMDSVTRTLEKQLTAMQIFRGETITVADGVINLGSAFTKTQANQLAMLKVSGATSDALKTMARSFEDFNKITSANTFDNSVAGIQRLRKEISEMNKVNELMTQGVKLTRDEIVNLVRDSERLTQQFQSEGLSAQQLDVALKGLEAEHVALAKQKNDLVAKSKESERQAKAEANAHIKAAQDQAKAVKYLEDVERRMAAAVDEANAGLDRGATDALVKYKQALMQAGIAADVAEAKMATLKSQMDLVASRKRAEDLKYLSRALSVQMGDVAISLASGMNPLLVMIQQGDQIRGVLDQVGAKGDELKNSMTAAAAQIATGMKNTAIAIGSFLGGAIMSTGKALTNLVVEITNTDKALLALKAQTIAYEGIMTTASGPGKWSTALRYLTGLVVGLTGALAVGGVAALTAWGVGLYQVIKQEDELAKSLILTGGSLGLTQTAAIDYAKSLNTIGVSTSAAIDVMTQMAKVGGFSYKEISTVVKAATEMHKYFNIAIEDTVKAYAKMKEDPVKNLLELAKSTGMVSAAIVENVYQLKEQGKSSEAVALAIKTLSDVNNTQLTRMKADYNDFSLFMINLGGKIKGFFDEVFKGIFYKASPSERIKQEIQKTQAALDSWGIGETYKKQLQTQLTELNKQLVKMKEVEDAERMRTEQQSAQAAIMAKSIQLEGQYQSQVEKHRSTIKDIENEINKARANGLAGTETEARLVNALAGEKERLAKALKGENKEASELERYMKRIAESVSDQKIKTDALGVSNSELTDAAKLRLDIMNDPLWAKVPQRVQEELLATLGVLDARQKEFNVAKKKQQLVEDEWKKTLDIRKKQDEAMFNYLEQSDKALETEQDRAKLLDFENKILGLTSEEQKILTREYNKQVELAKVERELQAEISRIKKEMAPEDRQAAIDQAEAVAAEKRKNINKDVANQAAKDYIDAFNKIRDTISDVIATALFEGGKAGQKKLKDLLKAGFKNFVIDVVINPLFKGGMNSILGMFSGGAGGTSGGVGSMLTNGLNNYLTNTALGTILTSTGGYAAAIGGGSIAAGSQAAMLAAQTAEFGLAGTALTAQAAGVGAAGTAGSAASSIMSGLSAIPGWGWAAMAVGALLASGFGKTPGEQHTGGFYSSSGQGTAMGLTDNQAWANDLTKRTNPELVKVVKSTVDGVLSSVNSTAKALGLNSIGIDAGFAANTNGKAKNKNAFGYFDITVNGEKISEYVNRELGSDVPKAIEKWTADMVEAANKALLKGKEDLALEGETATQTLNRLANNLTGVNKAFDLLGKTALSASLTSAEFASGLVAAFGSLESFNTAVSSYYEKYYSESERFATSQRQLIGQFTSLNLSVPATTAEFRKLVESQDLNTEAGRQMYASLLNLAPAFYEVASAIEGVMQSISDTTANSIREIEMSILNEKDKYEYLDKEIVGLIGKLSTATLPADIEKIFNQINSDITNAYGLLSDSEKERLAPEFIDRFNEAERLAQERLKIAEEQGLTQAQAAEKQVKAADAALAAAEEIRNAAAEYMEAAKTMLEAAKTEQTIKVDLSNGSSNEVNFA